MKKSKQFGEVFTPQYLVDDMLNMLPAEVWQNPNLKWLDPCVGANAIFALTIYNRLMNHLPIDDIEARREHILTKMIWMVELQEDSCLEVKKLFGTDNINLINDSYLTTTYDDKFNIIVMNPPYQELKEGNKKSKPLWNKFVLKALDELVEGGYLNAVHPGGWRNVNGVFKPVQMEIRKRDLIVLNVNNVKEGIRVFKCNTTFDYYLLHNVFGNDIETIIYTSEDKKIWND
jgi:tRNA1(Val) A37 N6-methylase TrmN6